MTYEQAKRVKKGDRIVVVAGGQSKELIVSSVSRRSHAGPDFRVSEAVNSERLSGQASWEVNWRNCSLPTFSPPKRAQQEENK